MKNLMGPIGFVGDAEQTESSVDVPAKTHEYRTEQREAYGHTETYTDSKRYIDNIKRYRYIYIAETEREAETYTE